jgi:hypothetical protein
MDEIHPGRLLSLKRIQPRTETAERGAAEVDPDNPLDRVQRG